MTEEQWMKEGENHLKANRYQQALAAYEQASRLYPKSADAYLAKGVVLSLLGRHQEALGVCEQAIYLDPSSATAYFWKGSVLFDLKRYAEALAACERAIQLDPNQADYHFIKGHSLYKCERYGEALAAFERASQIAPNDATYHSSKGLALVALNRYAEALAADERAIQLDPKNADSYASKGMVLVKLARWEDAHAALEQANRLDPSRDRIEELLRRGGKSEKAQPIYWVMRREASDAGPGGYYRRQQKYDGPFVTKAEALARAQKLNDEQRRAISDERLDKATRRALFEAGVNYWPMSEDEMEEARRNGTSIY